MKKRLFPLLICILFTSWDNNKKYAVLLTMDEEDPEMVIFEEIEDADGEITIASLDEADEDAVYDYYDSLCDEYFDDEDESEE